MCCSHLRVSERFVSGLCRCALQSFQRVATAVRNNLISCVVMWELYCGVEYVCCSSIHWRLNRPVKSADHPMLDWMVKSVGCLSRNRQVLEMSCEVRALHACCL